MEETVWTRALNCLDESICSVMNEMTKDADGVMCFRWQLLQIKSDGDPTNIAIFTSEERKDQLVLSIKNAVIFIGGNGKKVVEYLKKVQELHEEESK